jgi:ABC-type Fe3+/spermidine/putrescine transport system ATPase subunit
MTAGIALEALTLTLGSFCLNKLDLAVAADEIFVILGPNGSGKSVTLETIAGFHLPDSGRVLIHGRDVTRLPPERRNVGFVVQNFGLFPHLDVENNVAIAGVGRHHCAPCLLRY